MPFCGKCGAEVEPTERFCGDCGNQLGNTKPLPQFQNNFLKRTFFPIIPIVTIILLVFGGISALMFSKGYFSTNKDQFSDPVETKADEQLPTVVADMSTEAAMSFTEICEGWLMGGANLANSYFNASEKELSPPFRTIKEISIPADFYGENITLEDDAIYISGTHGNNDNAVYKYDRFSGDLLWRFRMLDASGSCSCPVTVTEQFVICGGQSSENLYILDKISGELLEAKKIVESLYSTPPKVDNSLVYTYGWTSLSESCLLCYDIEEDIIKWEVSSGYVQSEIAIYNDYLIGGRRRIDPDGVHFTLDTVIYSKRTGDIVWEMNEPRGLSITTNGKYVYTLIGDIKDGQVYYDRIVAYRIESGIKEWERQLNYGGCFCSKLAVSEQYLVVAATNYHELDYSKLLIYDFTTGYLVDEVELSGYINSLALANGYAYISTPSAFYAYNFNSNILEIIEELYVRDIAISNGNLVVLSFEKIIIYESKEVEHEEVESVSLPEGTVTERIDEPEKIYKPHQGTVDSPALNNETPDAPVYGVDDELDDWWEAFYQESGDSTTSNNGTPDTPVYDENDSIDYWELF